MIDLRMAYKELSQLEKKESELYHKLAVKANLSDSAFSILSYLYEQDGIITQNDLAEYLWLPKQTINSAVNKLLQDGYVFLKQLPVARNSKSVHLTEKGRALCDACISPVLEAEERAFLRMTETEIENYLALSRKQSLLLQEELFSLLQEKEVKNSE